MRISRGIPWAGWKKRKTKKKTKLEKKKGIGRKEDVPGGLDVSKEPDVSRGSNIPKEPVSKEPGIPEGAGVSLGADAAKEPNSSKDPNVSKEPGIPKEPHISKETGKSRPAREAGIKRARAKKAAGHRRKARRRAGKNHRPSALKIAARAAAVLAAPALVLGAVFWAVQASGKGRLYSRGEGMRMAMPQVEPQTETQGEERGPGGWQEGDVRYRGTHYRYNKDILTFLFLGIDKMSEVAPGEDGIDGGQSDALFLLVLNPHNKEIHIIGIPRDTMAEIDVYGRDGIFRATVTGQITLQHGYGDGGALSCERSVAAVSKLFYGLPIHGYCAVNMGAIPLLNDAVGGVELEALEDMDAVGLHAKKGEKVRLEGMGAYHYLKDRDIQKPGSAGGRLERQKQYLEAYAAAAMEAARGDLALPVTLYRTLGRYMATDISIDEAGYLGAQMPGYRLGEGGIRSLEGETVRGEKFEEFYADETALYELVLDVFYEEVQGQQARY